MRFLRVKLVNYIGIYNGMGLNTIEIDLTKCKNKILIIKGDNGSGKSTLKNSLTTFPDSNSKFIPEKPALKELDLMDDEVIYHIRFIHGVKSNGDRETTKAYISKQIGDCIEELNPNGNVTSYKDIIFEELKLDASFISLFQLSSEDKGLATKTPAERKKYVTGIISGIEVYNNIYKTLSKRSSIFKSMINSISSKIDLIGDKQKVQSTLSSLENRLNTAMNNKDNLIELKSSFKSKIGLLDPDGSLQIKGNEIVNSIIELRDNKDKLSNNIDSYYTKFNLENVDYSELLKQSNIIKDDMNKIESEISNQEFIISSLLSDREIESKELQIKTQKLNNLLDNKNYKDIKDRIELSKNKLIEYKKIISSIGLSDINNISKDEFILGLETIKDIKEMIMTFKSDLFYKEIAISANYVLTNDNSYLNILSDIDNKLASMNIEYEQLKVELQHNLTLKEVSNKLTLRPSNCSINECGFIKDALEAYNKQPDEKIKELEIKINNISDDIQSCEKDRIKCNNTIQCVNQLNILVRTIEKNSMILNKLPIGNSFTKENIINRILNNDKFKEIDELYSYIEYSNIIDEYKTELNIYNTLSNDYKVFESKSIIIDEINSDIEGINTKLDLVLKKIEDNQNVILEKKKSIIQLNNLLSTYDNLIKLYEDRDSIIKQLDEVLSRYSTIKTNLRIIDEALFNINKISNDIDKLNKEITPMIEERDTLKHGLSMLDSYNSDLELYTNKYNKVEMIRKYSSPSKGIQTLFMELYMNKTLSMANELLSLLFSGEYTLGQYIINENEFRIPCIGKGIPNDDISSMSSGEVSMISMILSFVLLKQSSTKYNIPEIDEMDAALDTQNRALILTVLDKLMDILEVEQCIMISHNEEINLANTDIIQLKTVNKISDGNIIFQY